MATHKICTSPIPKGEHSEPRKAASESSSLSLTNLTQPASAAISSGCPDAEEPDAPLTNLFAHDGKWSHYWGLKTPCTNRSHHHLCQGRECPIYYMVLGSTRGLVSFRPYVSNHGSSYGQRLSTNGFRYCKQSELCLAWEDFLRDLSFSMRDLSHGTYRVKVPWEGASHTLSSRKHFDSLLLKFHAYSAPDSFDNLQYRCRFVPPVIIIATEEQARIYDTTGWAGACHRELKRIEKWVPRVTRAPRVDIIDLTESDTPPPEESQSPVFTANNETCSIPGASSRQIAPIIGDCSKVTDGHAIATPQSTVLQATPGSGGTTSSTRAENDFPDNNGTKRPYTTSEKNGQPLRLLCVEPPTKRRETGGPASSSRRNQLDSTRTARKSTSILKQVKAKSKAAETERRRMPARPDSGSSLSPANTWIGKKAQQHVISRDAASALPREAQSKSMEQISKSVQVDDGIATFGVPKSIGSHRPPNSPVATVLASDDIPSRIGNREVCTDPRLTPAPGQSTPPEQEQQVSGYVRSPPLLLPSLSKHNEASLATLARESSARDLPEQISEAPTLNQSLSTETHRPLNSQMPQHARLEPTTIARQEETPDSTVLDNDESLPSPTEPVEADSRASGCEFQFLDELSGLSTPIDHVILRWRWSYKNPHLHYRTTQAWKNANLQENEARASRKDWFGKVTERLRWRRQQDDKTRELARPRGQPLLRISRFKTMDETLDLNEDQLPGWIKTVPIRRKLWALKKQKRLDSLRGPKKTEELCLPEPFGFVNMEKQRLTPEQKTERAQVFAFLRQ